MKAWTGALLFAVLCGIGLCEAPGAQTGDAGKMAVAEMEAGKQALGSKNYTDAERHFREVLKAEAGSVPARMGLADAELALHAYEPAELDYRRVVASEPQMWVAHKNLVIVEAALGRWEEFDRERAVLRAARERGADGISARESDVIDGFSAAGKHWIVREYFEPVGRSQTRYNFESFGADGRVSEYISLESEAAAKAALATEAPVRVGDAKPGLVEGDRYALNWYTGKAHGAVHVYGHDEPGYERVRADVQRWLRSPHAGAEAGR